MVRAITLILSSLLLLACVTQPNNREKAEGQPLHVIKADTILVISVVGKIKTFPRSFGDVAASVGRDINAFNDALEWSIPQFLSKKLMADGKKLSFGNAYVEDIKYHTKKSQLPYPTPNIVLIVSPTNVSMNIPGSFSGTFSATVYDPITSEQLWQGHFKVSRIASSKAHREAAEELATAIHLRLKEVGFI